MLFTSDWAMLFTSGLSDAVHVGLEWCIHVRLNDAVHVRLSNAIRQAERRRSLTFSIPLNHWRLFYPNQVLPRVAASSKTALRAVHEPDSNTRSPVSLNKSNWWLPVVLLNDWTATYQAPNILFWNNFPKSSFYFFNQRIVMAVWEYGPAWCNVLLKSSTLFLQ